MGSEAEYSINTGRIRTFNIADYVVFILVLVINAVIGIFYAFKDRNKQSPTEFMVAGKSMAIVPVALSMAVTFLSATTLLGNPVEVYNFDMMFWWLCLGFFFAILASAHVFIPFFYRLNITTVFEYLQMRFNTPVRILGSIILIIQTLVYFSFLLYVPSLALGSVTSISVWGSVIGMGVVVSFYTALGGIKAVVWTDSFQAIIILAGLLAVLIQGSIVTGGFANAWEIADKHGRTRYEDFSMDPSTRHSFWSVVIGGGFFWMSSYGVNQAQVQRALSLPTLKNAQIALWINLPFIAGLSSLCFMIGVVMFAFYSQCSPDGIISKRDQLVPLFVMDTLADYPGVPGLFVACIFSGSLSSLSSGLNALSSVLVKDLVLPYCCRQLSDFKITLLSKLSVVLFSGLGIAAAYLVGRVEGLLQSSYQAYSILNGPVFGMFLLGMFFPWANSLGAFVGFFVALVFMGWIGIGSFWYKVSTAKLSPVITSGCVWRNITTNVTTTTIAATTIGNMTTTISSIATKAANPAYALFTLSYLYYTITGAAIAVVVGLIFSFITGYTKPSEIDPRLIFPLFDTVFPFLPECILRPLRCGINHKKKYERREEELPEIEKETYKELEISIDTDLKTTSPQSAEKPPATASESANQSQDGSSTCDDPLPMSPSVAPLHAGLGHENQAFVKDGSHNFTTSDFNVDHQNTRL